jgi:hypothetical protein
LTAGDINDNVVITISLFQNPLSFEKGSNIKRASEDPPGFLEAP